MSTIRLGVLWVSIFQLILAPAQNAALAAPVAKEEKSAAQYNRVKQLAEDFDAVLKKQGLLLLDQEGKLTSVSTLMEQPLQNYSIVREDIRAGHDLRIQVELKQRAGVKSLTPPLMILRSFLSSSKTPIARTSFDFDRDLTVSDPVKSRVDIEDALEVFGEKIDSAVRKIQTTKTSWLPVSRTLDVLQSLFGIPAAHAAKEKRSNFSAFALAAVGVFLLVLCGVVLLAAQAGSSTEAAGAKHGFAIMGVFALSALAAEVVSYLTTESGLHFWE